jgi:hypothetical protein
MVVARDVGATEVDHSSCCSCGSQPGRWWPESHSGVPRQLKLFSKLPSDVAHPDPNNFTRGTRCS